MQPQKVYESAVYLLSNLIADEKLRYELSITETLKEKTINLINGMLYLEFDHQTEMNNTKFAPIFAKAYVNITKEKTEFEKPSNSSVEKVYSSYSELIAYLVTKFNADKNKIESTNIKPNEDEIKLNAKITADMKEKYKQPEPDVIQKNEQKQDSVKFENKNNTNGQTANNNNPNLNQNSNNFNYFGKSVINPLQDPRFYPYNKKVKGMKWIRMSIAIVAILMAVLFMTFYTFAINQKINIDKSNSVFGNLFNGWKPVIEGDYNYSQNINLLNFTFSRGFSTGTYGLVLSYFYGIAAIATFVYFTFFLPIKIPAEGFRMQLTLYIIIILFLIINLFETTSFFDIDKFIKANMNSYFKSVFYKDGGSLTLDQFNSDFNTLWTEVTRQTKTVVWTLLAVLTSVFCFIAAIFGTAVIIINPKRDREKIMRAVMSYQQAMAAAMAGTPYSMDESLYDKELMAILEEQRIKKEKKNQTKKDKQKD
ncbi:hypothetical protein [Spiroplasma endosymbiont of Labia minor]|uniref:hypothetical protein n=1 Tax=Spiroplasma endosymbiont of Labia minor TaxID=3066305 RepID=UPI0030CD322D